MITSRDSMGRIAKGTIGGLPIYAITKELLREADELTPYGESRLRYVSNRVGCSPATVSYAAKRLGFQWTPKARKKALYTTTHVERRYVYSIGCVICGERRVVDAAHLIPRKEGGWGTVSNIIPMCPTHHRCYDKGSLLDHENNKLVDFIYQKFPSLSNEFAIARGES